MSRNRIFYACAGSADLINSCVYWQKGQHDPNQVSITFSSQILQYCKEVNAEIYMISSHSNSRCYRDESILIEHKPKRKLPLLGQRLSYYLGELSYGFSLLWRALRFRSDVVLIDSGTTYYFLLFLFRLFGVKVVVVLHNTLWPTGFPLRNFMAKLILWADKWFFRYGVNAILTVSKECDNQVLSLCGPIVKDKLVPFRAQFRQSYFDDIAPPPPFEQRPFKTLFIGRVAVFKGVLDIVDMAERLQQRHPDQFRWVICGTGPALDALRAKVIEKGLSEIIEVPGWVSLETLAELYRDCHMSIVPTTDGFNEGLAMTAAESALSGRPVITSGVVPAAGEMPNACYKAETNNIDSFVNGFEHIAFDKSVYEKMRLACADESRQFLDRDQGLTAVLHRVLANI